MKDSLQTYNHLSGQYKVDTSAFWVLFGTLLGFGAGMISAIILSHYL
jgi:hypothetical protein